MDTCDADADCPFGFACDDLDGGNYCQPIAGTCGRCLDHDGDTRGAGRCGAVDEAITDVDCDDDNPGVYYSAANPRHPFPDRCGDFDDNCNGLSDRVEQLGSADHCATCGDVCRGRAGEIANAIPTCVEDEATTTFECVAACQPGFADCDGDLSTGCETPLGDDRIRYNDLDSDGRGDPATARYMCPGAVPSDWVENNLDCDDEARNVYGGDAILVAAPEICDGVDNDCNDERDDNPISMDVACDTGVDGICGPGMTACQDAGTDTAALVCNGTVDPSLVADVGEVCDGRDNDCDGAVDEGVDYHEDLGESNPGGSGAAVACGVPDGIGACGFGTFQCLPVTATPDSSAFQCVGAAPASDSIDDLFEDTDCDGSDGTLSGAVFVRPRSAGGSLDGNDANPGTAQRPVATLNRALALACGGTAVCQDIFVSVGVFESSAAIELPGGDPAAGGVRIYGGFETRIDCSSGLCELTWERTAGHSTIRRLAPAANTSSHPYGRSYAAFTGSDATSVTALLQGLRIEVAAPGAAFLSDGQTGPDQIGIQCGAGGCERLEFVDTTIDIEPALNGGTGVSATIPATDAENGPDGATPAQEASVSYTTLGVIPGFYGGSGGSCTAGGSFAGGYAGAIRTGAPSEAHPDAAYRFHGEAGNGPGVAGGGIWQPLDVFPGWSPFTIPPAAAERGCDGSGGGGGRAPARATPIVRATTGASRYALDEVNEALVGNPTRGNSGSGGGGGGGCLVHYLEFMGENFPAWTCSAIEAVGGAGGGGGCAGLDGQNGGHGGSVIGVWLVPPISGATQVVAAPGRFTVRLGNAGAGANGSSGSDGAPGGYGGRLQYQDVYHAWWQGGHGGNGGGGGGGAGGTGGSNVALVRMCPSGTTCTFSLPPQMLAAPADYFTIGDSGDAGEAGDGGVEGTKPPRAGVADGARSTGCTSSSPNGGAGTDGGAGQVFTFLDTSGDR
ncbi:MAG: hypothetical protein ACJAYU_001696 [Bradymonadia bacterium]